MRVQRRIGDPLKQTLLITIMISMVVINLIVGGNDLSNPEGKDGPDAGVGGQGGEQAQQACHQHAE